MKTLITILLFFGLVLNSSFSKIVMSYPAVISKADLIVEGKISDVSFSVYEYNFNVTEYIKGESQEEIIINMWKEWSCDKRIKRAEKGQKLLLFLTKRSNGEYEIINGSTGELFITENDSLQTFFRYKLPKREEFKSAIRMFSKAFKYHSKTKEKSYYKKLVKQSEIDIMIKENKFFKSMVLMIESKIKKP